MNISRREAVISLGLGLLSLTSRPKAALAPAAHRDEAAFLAAVRRGDAAAVEKLLADHPALARATDPAGRSAFVLAHLSGHAAVAAAIRARGLELDVVEAVLAEDRERVKALLEARPELCNRAHPIGGTPLYAAALVGDLQMWRLRSLGCKPDAAPPGGSGFTPARAAVDARTSVEAMCALTDLLSNGGDPNARQKDGDSILHGAVRRRDERLVRVAVRKGCDVTARDDSGRTPAALAAELGWKAGAALLARHASLPRDDRGSRFAYDASRQPIRRPDLSDVSQKLQSEVTGASHGRLADVRRRVSKDRRLAFSLSTDDELAIEASAHMGHRDLMRYLLDQGAPLSLPTAVSLGDEEFVKFLLDEDPALINERGAHDFPVMYYTALGAGSIGIAELLRARGASVNQESHGVTTLHWCVKRGRLSLARWLLDNGADPNVVGYKWRRTGETPLQIARATGYDEMAELLRKRGAAD